MGKTAQTIVVGLDREDLLLDLNKAYCDEWLAYFSYRHMAAVVSGGGYEDMQEFLDKTADLEAEHIRELAQRISELGGVPVSRFDLIEKNSNYPYPNPPENSDDYKGIVETVTNAEKGAINVYHKIANKTLGKDHATYQLATHILSEEIQHEERFENLLEKHGAMRNELAELAGMKR